MANTYLTRNQTNGNQDKWTFSGWVKRSKLGAAQCIFATSNGSTTSFDAKFDSSDRIDVYNYLSGGYGARLVTNRVFRDTNAWYHIVIVYDSGNSTEAQRLRIYVNGTEESSFSTTNYPSLNENSDLNVSGSTLDIGRQQNGSQFFDGLMSHLHLSDGYAYAPTVFGSTDSTTGEWKINTSPSITMGTNGFTILKDGNTITDQSSNSNNFTSNGSGVTKTEDNPSNNFCTWNPLAPPTTAPTFSNGNTTAAIPNSGGRFRSSFGLSSGKYYCEVKINSLNAAIIGISPIDSSAYTGIFSDTSGIGLYGTLGSIYKNGSNIGSIASVANGDIVGMAIDLDNNNIYFSKNGQYGSGLNGSWNQNFAGAYGVAINSGHFYAITGQNGGSGTSSNISMNFGNGYFGTTAVSSAGTNASNNGIFEYDVPTGYTALSTKGLNL